MGRRRLGLGLLLTAGIGLAALSVATGALGIVAGDHVIGWAQLPGLVLGTALAVLAGVRLLRLRQVVDRTRSEVQPAKIHPASPVSI